MINRDDSCFHDTRMLYQHSYQSLYHLKLRLKNVNDIVQQCVFDLERLKPALTKAIKANNLEHLQIYFGPKRFTPPMMKLNLDDIEAHENQNI